VNAADHNSPLETPAAQGAFIAAMQRPASYTALHGVTGPVRCIETHISWVFLTGRYAYKVKKPLRLSFLDYSSPARRAQCCREELRLNRRHAPDLYLDVVPIAGTPDQPVVGGAGPAFEHALRMLQFDPAEELAHLLQSGHLGPGEIAALGGSIARTQQAADRVAADDRFGMPDTVHRITLENFTEIARLLPGAGGLLGDMRSRIEIAFAQVRALMSSRREHGFVRECHGDLHCGNVVRWQGRLVPFDGLEFDPALRFIDVASDLAFLSMDLGAHDRADLRRELLNAWTVACGDFAAVALLPYYEGYRALVRAKVAALRGQQARGVAAADSAALAHRYLKWERGRMQRQSPSLIVMAGLSGSGKTWLSTRLATACDAFHLRSDIERKRLAGLGPLDASNSPPDGGLYTRAFNERTYARLRECVESCLAGGESVLVDAANLRRHERQAFVQIAARHGAPATIVHCSAPVEERKARVARRSAAAADASEATEDLLERQTDFWEPLAPDEQGIALTVDTTDAAAVSRVLEKLKAGCSRAAA
jgi:aminoglycoside phosphotransferase family enzyme/predicted kinase